MKTHGTLKWMVDSNAERVAGQWGVKAAPYVVIKMKRMFPRLAQNRGGVLLLTDTAEVARDIEWLTSRYPLEMDADTRARLEERAQEHRDHEVTVMEILSGARPHLPFREPARPAREYQLVAADLALATGGLLLADDLGLGKSMSALLMLREPAALPALIVCPTHLPEQWQHELELTLPWLKAHVLRTGRPYDPRFHRSMYGETPDVLICGYSKLRGWGDYLTGKMRSVIFDEAQELRRRDSDKWRAAAMIADGASWVMGLTATPVYNYAGEIHTIFEIIAPGALGTRDEFIREWAGAGIRSLGPDDHVSVSDSKALGAYLRAEGLMLRRTRKEVGRELPEVTRVNHAIATDEDVFDEEAAEAFDLAAMLVSRDGTREELFQAAGNFDWKMRRATGVAKAPYVAEFVRMLLETDEQVVLFGWHRSVYDIWLERLKAHRPVLYTGSESPNQKARSRDAFLAGDARVLIMSLRSGAGLDGLQECAHVAVFGELDWSPGMHDQCIGRLHRDGQDDPVLAYFLLSVAGTDPLMAEVLNLKRQSSAPIVDPDAPLLQPVDNTQDRVRRLAEAVLERRRVRV